MKISKKCQYALKAVFELAWRNKQDEPVKTYDIAEAQHISPRFMEIILNELKHGGFVESRRGNEGGYILARDPKKLTVREVIEFIQGPISASPNAKVGSSKDLRFGDLAFNELWQQANNAMHQVFESKTFAELVEFEEAKSGAKIPNYSI